VALTVAREVQLAVLEGETLLLEEALRVVEGLAPLLRVAVGEEVGAAAKSCTQMEPGLHCRRCSVPRPETQEAP